MAAVVFNPSPQPSSLTHNLFVLPADQAAAHSASFSASGRHENKYLRKVWKMDYTNEDTQNSAPGEPTMHETNKLSSGPKKADSQSVTKR